MNKYVVLDEHTLGAIVGSQIQILRSSVVRGSPHPSIGIISLPNNMSRLRQATIDDFRDYGVTVPPDLKIN
jgi:hypothetical protein